MGSAITPFVSVIIPVFETLDGLRRCLAPLAEQTYPRDRYEVLVVDNGSRGDVRSVVESFPQTQLMQETRPGSYAARNLAIVAAHGDVLAFTDSDCVPSREWIERGVANLLRAPDCGFVAGRIELVFRDPSHPTPSELYDLVVMNFHQDRNVAERHFGATANLFAFKQVFAAVGPFDGQLLSAGDLEWGRRVFDKGLQQIYAADVSVAHPARYSLAETYRQATRLVGGRYGLERQSGATPMKLALDLARAWTPALGFYGRLLRDPRLKQMRQRVSVVLVAFVVKYVGAWELLRLMMGGQPRRG